MQIEALQEENARLEEKLESSENRIRELHQELEREQNTRIRLQHEISPMYHSYGQDNGAESQRY